MTKAKETETEMNCEPSKQYREMHPGFILKLSDLVDRRKAVTSGRVITDVLKNLPFKKKKDI